MTAARLFRRGTKLDLSTNRARIIPIAIGIAEVKSFTVDSNRTSLFCYF